MLIAHCTALTATLFALMTVPPAPAQGDSTPPLGKWTGTVTPPSGQSEKATFDVAMKDGKLTIAIEVVHGVFPASDIKVEPGTLTFSFSPGGSKPVTCVLNRKDDHSYEGPCKDEDGPPGKITMTPPEKR